MTLLENLVEMVPAGRMALFDVALRLILFFLLTIAVLDSALEWTVNLDLANESLFPFGF